MHLPIILRNAAVAHENRHLVQRFRMTRPEVPRRDVAAQVRVRIALLRVDEIRKLERIADKEHRRVIADDVPVALLGVELDREAAHVALGIGRAALARHRRESHEKRRFLADLREHLRLRVARDIVRDLQRAECARTFCVDTAFRNHFAIEVSEFFEQPDVLQNNRTA